MSKQCLDQVEARCARAESALSLLIGIHRDLSGIAFAVTKDRLEGGLKTRMNSRHNALTRPAFEDIQGSIERIHGLQEDICATMEVFADRLARFAELSEQRRVLRAAQSRFSPRRLTRTRCFGWSG
jgi:hypothetical protein